MSKYLTGIDGALYCDGTKVGRVSDWSFSGEVDALETTTLGDYAKTFASGVQSYSGSCSVFCYEDEIGQLESSVLTGDVIRTGATPYDRKHRLKLQVKGQVKNREIECDVVITSVDFEAAAGDVMKADISFVVTGGLIAAGLGVI